jgi:hypothetical protein
MVITRPAAQTYVSVCDLPGTAAGNRAREKPSCNLDSSAVRIWPASIGQPAGAAVQLFCKLFNTMGAT